MKQLILIITILFSLATIAQTTDISPEAGIENQEKNKGQFRDNISLSFETEYATVRNKDEHLKITGHTQFYRLELAHKYEKFQSSIGVDYVERDYNDEESEADRRDQIDNVFFKFRHETAKFKENGIADLRLQYRYYYTTDYYFRERYGSDGNYQLRAYFGRPIKGKFYISKYTSYLRYKKYQFNTDAGDRTREYELRGRISPVYRPNRDLEFGVTTTYNHIFTKTEDDEKIDLGISARKQFGKYAILFFTSSDYYVKNDNGDLVTNDDFWDDTTFFLNFNVIIF